MSIPILMHPPYEIEVPDISLHQNYTQYGEPRKIDFAKVATNKKVRAVMVKLGEGTWDGYPIDEALDQINGFHNVGLPIIPYHFWHFEVNPSGQAKYFKNRVRKLSWVPRRQMVDIEDTDPPEARPPGRELLASEYCIWIPKARKIAISVRDTMDAFSQEFGDAPLWYGGEWYQGWWTWLAELDGLDMSWIKRYYLQCASYTSPYMYICTGFSQDKVLFWQRTSRPPENEQIDGFPFKAALDMNSWLLSEEQWEEYIQEKSGETYMSGIYDMSLSNKEKWKGVWLSQEDKNINLQNVCAGSDFLLMNCVSQDCEGMDLVKDSAFPIWTERTTKPVGMVVELDQDLFWKKEIPLPVFQDSTKRNMWNNETIRAIFEQWRRSTITNYEWENKKLNISADDNGWHPINGIFIRESALRNHGDFINGMWQTAVLDDILKPLTTLMEGKYIPKVPIYLMATEEWYKAYANDTTWQMKARIGNGQIKGLGLIRKWGEKGTENIITDEAPMALPYLPMLDDAWNYVPSDYYTYPWTEPGVTYSFFVFSFNRLMVENIFYSDKPITPITAMLGARKATTWYEDIGWKGTLPPVEPPPTDNEAIKALQNSVLALEQWRKDLGIALSNLPK